jgi:hypothetical protein
MVAWHTPATGQTQENLVSHTLPRTAWPMGRPPRHFALGARRLIGGRDEEDPMNSLGSPTEDTIEAVHRELNDPRATGALFGGQFLNIFGGELPGSLSHPRSRHT